MIEVKNLTVKRGKFSLNNLSLTIEKGESLALIGPSGAGKTLFLETILGLRKPSNGSVYINGRDVLLMKPETSSIAYLPQDLALFPHLSVYENIAFCLKIKSKTAEYIDTVVSRLASQLRIDYLLSRKSVSNLSGGEKQRVALARALAANPDLVFLDEPFSALDGARRRELHVEVNKLHKTHNFTLVFVTHDLDETLVVANKVALMKNGNIIQTGTPKEMFENPVSAWAAHFLLFENIFKTKPVAVNQYSFEDIIIHSASAVPTKKIEQESSGSDRPSGQSQWLACKARAFSVRETTDSENPVKEATNSSCSPQQSPDRGPTDFFNAIAGDTFHYGLTEVIELFVNEEKTAKLYAKAPLCSIKPGAKVIAEYDRTQVKLVEG